MKYIGPRDNPATVEEPYPPYVNGDRQSGIKGSIPDGDVFEAIQREIETVIINAGLTPDLNDLTQLWKALLATVQRHGLATAAGTATAIEVTTDPATGSLQGGLISIFSLSNALDLAIATTLDLDGHGTKPLRDLDGEAQGTAPAGRAILVWYNGVHFRVLAGLDGATAPSGPLNPPASYPNKQVFSFTGADQLLDLGALAFTEATPENRFMKFKAWAAAGATWYAVGGAGGFVEGEIRLDGTVIINGQPVNSTTVLALIVGQSGGLKGSPTGGTPATGDRAYGFGGAGAGDGLGSDASVAPGGGGLSGIFVGSAGVVKTSAARALMVAGGGSGMIEVPGNVLLPGISGDEPPSGGEADMQGIDKVPVVNSNDSYNGGGGGYTGGTAANTNTDKARGGESYINPAVLNPVEMNVNGGSTTAPNSGDPDYVAGVGAIPVVSTFAFDGQTHFQPDGNGLIVVEWN